METWKKFIEETSSLRELLEKYLEIRLLLKELGHTEKTITKISSGPNKLFELRAEIAYLFDHLKKHLHKYGFNIPESEVNLYLQSKMDKIDLLIPLNDANN
jgi:hypothetical protein